LTDESISREGESTVRAAAVQLTSTADRERNLATADRLTREAAAAGAA
jgi:predicted amidohydrolase